MNLDDYVVNKDVVFLTGSGISVASGVPTYRAQEGLWHEYKIEDVASIEGFQRDPELVWEFYNKRRKELSQCEPNAAHHAIKKAEDICKSTHIITQNIDGLHQRAGSVNVYPIHGNLQTTKCNRN